MDSAHKSNNNPTTRIPTRSISRLRREPFSDLTNTTPIPSSRSKPVPDSQPASDPQPAIPSTAGGDEIGGGKAFTPKSKEASIDFFAGDNVGNNDQNIPKAIIQLSHSPCKTLVDSSDKSNSNKIDHIQTRSSSRQKRKPFSDVSNTYLSSLSKSVPESEPVLDSEPLISSTAGGETVNGDSTSTPISKEAFMDFCDDVDNNDKFGISTVYSRRAKTRRKGKEKAAEAASALSCPPLGRITSIGSRSTRLKAHVEDLHKAFSDPSDKTRKRTLHKSMPTKLQKPRLPPDFVEKQKAYFAEIDAFELPEEEVSEDALE